MTRRLRWSEVGASAPLLIALLFYLFPLVVWLLGLLNRPEKISASAIYYAQIGTTATIAILSALAATVMGGAVACLAAFSSAAVSRRLSFIMTVPLLIGFVARNYSWVGLLSHFHSGPFSVIGHLQDSRLGVVVVLAIVFTPFAYFICDQGALRFRSELLEAARTLGATDVRAFWVITVPLLLPALLVSVAATFILGLGYFVTPQLIGGGNFPFIGNGVLMLLNDLGDATAASRLALDLYVTVLSAVALACLVFWVVWRRGLALERNEEEEES